MKEQKNCPNCNISNSNHAKICKNCGFELSLGLLVNKDKGVETLLQDHPYSVSPEILVPKMGAYLVEKGDISEEDLAKALAYQKEKSDLETPILLGQALLELNIINREKLDLAVTEQIFDLQNALKDSNLMLEQRVEERTLELQYALDQLSELSELKSHFISNISHELKTPLSHMIGYIEMLGGEILGPLNEEQTKAIEVLDKSNTRLSSLIDNLIQFTLISKEEISLEKTEFQVSQMFDQIFRELGKKERKRNIRVNYEKCDDSIYIRADEEKITWVIKQILENAIKFNKDGGNVFLYTATSENELVINVKDTGIGIAEEELKTIFEPFHQLDSSATREYDGTGIGLSLAKQILVAHGSDLIVSSNPEKGSTFRFSLEFIKK